MLCREEGHVYELAMNFFNQCTVAFMEEGPSRNDFSDVFH